jgi:protein-S-isoprenylcysteine O-methyltransferase Ste14
MEKLMAWWLAFIFISVGLIYLSRHSLRSLRAPRSHGFYRFFAWEFILALILLNLPAWFRDPFAWYQVISWLLLLASLIPLLWGVNALRSRGRPGTRAAAEPHLLSFEKTTDLVTNGIYRYIRHPMYSSLLLLTWGVFCKLPSAPGMLLALAASISLLATAKADEAECLSFFGPAYGAYMEQTKRFLPYFF